jgi:hypothetical protein
MSKKIDELEGKLSQHASILSTWKSLVNHAGWKMYEAILKDQRDTRLLVLGEPTPNFGAVLPQEFMKGEGSGLGLALTLPRLQIEILESDTKRLETEVQLEKHNESAKEKAVLAGGRVDSVDWHGGSGLESSPSGGAGSSSE